MTALLMWGLSCSNLLMYSVCHFQLPFFVSKLLGDMLHVFERVFLVYTSARGLAE